MIEYSLGLVAGYVCAKAITPHSPRLVTKNYHIHHWMWGTIVLCVLLILRIEDPLVIGTLTGVVLEGLSYENWKLKRRWKNE